MKRCLLLLTLLLLPGCDVAVAALLFSSDSGSSDDDPVALSSDFGPVAKVWLANIPDDAAAQIERANLVNQNGNPTAPVWTELGQLFVTDVFDPDPTVTFNAILIQVSEEENFNLDAIEVLDSTGDVVGHATGSTYASFVQPEFEILNAPDGVCAVTAAAGDVRAFIFTLYPSPVDRFRINLRGATQPPLPGDVLAQAQPLPGFAGENQRPGGMAVDANGIVYLTHSRGDTGHLTLFNIGGLTLPTATQFGGFGTVQIAADLATAGSHGVAVDGAGVMYTACSITTGIIQVRRILPGAAPGDNPVLDVLRDFSSTFNGDRVESNGIALDQTGNVVVVGGFSSLLSGRNHWRVKIPNTVTGTAIWQSSASIDSSSGTYWRAVTTVGDETVTTGDLFSGQLLGGTNQIYTSIFDMAGVASLDDSYPPGESSPDVGNSVALDSSGNIYIGGYATTGANSRNGILVRYEPGFSSGRDETIQGVAGLDDEILDIAVDTDGSIFVVGYETTALQGENMFIRKYTYDTALDFFDLVWERTHDGGGDDRAVSVVISGNYLIVAGYQTEAATTKVKLRVYAK